MGIKTSSSRSSASVPLESTSTAARDDVQPPRQSGLWQGMVTILTPLASLKITVVLFLLAIFIVFAGTLAQTEKDIWQVVHDYFRMDFSSWESLRSTAFSWIDFRIFFPRSFFPNMQPIPWGVGFFFPNGWLIGFCMLINLTAAHLIRFRIQGKGTQLTVGVVTLLIGIVLTTVVILAGSHQTASQLQLFTDWPSLRILWLLTQCTAASLVLLFGCLFIFQKRAGIVLLHSGIGLLMLGELIVGVWAVECQMQIVEGQTSNVVMDSREVELAVIDPSDALEDDVLAIPQSRLKSDAVIDDDPLPFGVQVVRFMPNSEEKPATPGTENLATAGYGLQSIAEEADPISSTDKTGRSNQTAAYVRIVDPDTQEPLGVYLLTLQQWMRGRLERVEVDGRTYEIALRYRHDYKPYSMHLVDVSQDVYMGTQMAKSYASELRLVDPTHNVDRRVRIWMNNPLRYGGATFYQSNYGRDASTGLEYTGLQVVTNTGWRIPYVACMMVVVGMLAQFWVRLKRFLTRRAAGKLDVPELDATDTGAPSAPVVVVPRFLANNNASRPAVGYGAHWLVPLVVVLLGAGWLLSKVYERPTQLSKIDYAAFGRLPVTYEGRIKPFDTLARNCLRVISDRQTYRDENGQQQPAVRWLLDVITDSEAAAKHEVFRIYNLDILNTLGVQRRQGFRYSINDFRGQLEELDKQVRKARQTKPDLRDLYSKKILELDNKLNLYLMLREAFSIPQLRVDELREDLAREANRREQYADYPLPLAVPPRDENGSWKAYTFALFDAIALQMAATQGRVETEPPNPATVALMEVLTSYDEKGGNAAVFNEKVKAYRQLLVSQPPAGWHPGKTDFEVSFNHAAPLYYAMILYFVAFVIGCFSWMGWSAPLQRCCTWLTAFTLIVHTLALIGRIYISGRPPVTNLYTSALFISWACVILGLLLERYSKIGVANVVAAFAGFASLLIAFLLTTAVISFKGDSFTVLVAVLDTNFWLATHVVCITVGYSATFLAGLLGIVYVLRGVLSPSLSPPIAKSVSRMVYGTVCFAIFFSFFGTVLGGLWADDSWGRFWGWDPKENGALIIVLWNAVVLHALWGRLVGDRGLAVLAIVGNIVTAWSWFGVNELNVGLHTYGFTEGVLKTLAVVVAIHLAIIALGVLPKKLWISNSRLPTAT